LNRNSALLAGVVAVVGALLAAAAYLATNAWFGAGDLPAMIFWSLPLGLMIAATLSVLSRRLARTRTRWHYVALVPIGATIGFSWTIAAAFILGGWIGAFSFPVLFCWVFGGVLGGIAAAWINQPRSWPTGLLLAVFALAALGRLNVYAQAPEPRVRVILKPGATSAEVQRVWNEVLGHPIGRGDEHYMLPELSSVSASGYDGKSAVLTVAIRKSTSQRQRDSLVALIRSSPLVVRVANVPARDTSGVRSSVSY
jgi:lysylphosphatidylglycerol synthetase-like protein (DUF2156 family)